MVKAKKTYPKHTLYKVINPPFMYGKYRKQMLEAYLECIVKKPKPLYDSEFSKFIRNATPEEKAKVYEEVLRKATEKQNMRQSNDTRYGASKRLYDAMEQRDRELKTFTFRLIALAIIATTGILVVVFL